MYNIFKNKIRIYFYLTYYNYNFFKQIKLYLNKNLYEILYDYKSNYFQDSQFIKNNNLILYKLWVIFRLHYDYKKKY